VKIMSLASDVPQTEHAAVAASFNYLKPMPVKPVNYACEPPAGVPRSNIVPDPHEVEVFDARRIDASLDREGFALVGQRSAVQDFFDDDEVRSVYYPEVEQLLRAVTGASRVFIFDHTTRRRAPEEALGSGRRGEGVPRGPVARVHVDHTEESGPQRIRDFLGDEAGDLLAHRTAVVNVWRPTRGPLEDAPLAVCDARSVDAGDLVGTDLVYRDRVGETYSVRYSPAHRWYFYPHMRRDEALLIKCYDSRRDVARFAPHSAFENPLATAGALPRESIELRTFLFFPN
jgi:hypothetical protein